jgi:hypothetical protein
MRMERNFCTTAARRLLVVVVTCGLESGEGGLFPVAPAIEAMSIANAHAANSHATRVAIAEATVKIFNMRPASGPVRTTVTLTGFGFTNDNTVHFGTGVIAHVPIKSAIGIACTTGPNCRGGIQQMLVFVVPDVLPPACPLQSAGCSTLSRQTAPGNYPVSVENEKGKTKELWFTVTGGSTTGPSSQ